MKHAFLAFLVLLCSAAMSVAGAPVQIVYVPTPATLTVHTSSGDFVDPNPAPIQHIAVYPSPVPGYMLMRIDFAGDHTDYAMHTDDLAYDLDWPVR